MIRKRRRSIVYFLFLLLFVSFALNSFLYGYLTDIGVSDKPVTNKHQNTTRRTTYDKSVYKDFFSSIHRVKLSITKELSLSEINKYILYHNGQIELYLRKIQLEKENTDDGDGDDDDDDDEEEENTDNRNDKHNAVNRKPNDNTILIDYVDRALIIKYLKIEKYFLNKKINRLNSVRSVLIRSNVDLKELPDIWHYYHLYINELQLYNDTDSLRKVLGSLANEDVHHCTEKARGTQIKLTLTLKDGTLALLKPMRVARDYETPPDHFYFVDFERHHAEIAAYHVDRILGFNRVPPTVGRIFNMTSELLANADLKLKKTFFVSPAGNLCFTGHCSYYCDTTHAVCGKPIDRLEASLQLVLPRKPYIDWSTMYNPYRRSYNKRKKTEWEMDDNYCENRVFQDVNFQSKSLLDLIDVTIFDFLTGNMDRHHLEKLESLSNDSFIVHLDNGRAFGRALHDEMSILAPLMQCCLVRYTTVLKLINVYSKQFSRLLDASLKNDPLYPILTDGHLRAIDRRLKIIIDQVFKCTQKYSIPQVLIDDGY